ncbi:MAG: 8-amino-7-oxononanoate synthase [Pseudomonadota bacterium]
MRMNQVAEDWIAQQAQQREQEHRQRQRLCVERREPPFIHIENQTFIDFASNDYLGFSCHPAVIDAYRQAALHYGVGSGAAHLVNGHSEEHSQLEKDLAKLLQRDAVLLFSTGYMANLGMLGAFANKHSVFLEDKLNHASLIDAGQQSHAQFKRYAHNDLDSLEKRLQQSPDNMRKWIVTDGVFSMDGDLAPLPEMAALARDYQASLIVDDAHGMGVLGARGAGLVEQTALSQQQVPLLMGTLGKALGTFGAFVAGPSHWIEHIMQTARSYIYTTALPPSLAAAARASLSLLNKEPQHKHQLHTNIAYFRQSCRNAGLELLPSESAIQPLIIGDNAKTQALAAILKNRGFWVGAIRPPTVPQGTARLRITLSAAHQPKHITQLVEHLAAALNRY